MRLRIMILMTARSSSITNTVTFFPYTGNVLHEYISIGITNEGKRGLHFPLSCLAPRKPRNKPESYRTPTKSSLRNFHVIDFVSGYCRYESFVTGSSS